MMAKPTPNPTFERTARGFVARRPLNVKVGRKHKEKKP